jgi:DnaJ-class molecular chaperone
MGQECSFCNGKGKIGITPCKTCKGEKRILGKQKLSGLKITGENTKIESMGHHAKNGNVGHLYLVKKSIN